MYDFLSFTFDLLLKRIIIAYKIIHVELYFLVKDLSDETNVFMSPAWEVHRGHLVIGSFVRP